MPTKAKPSMLLLDLKPILDLKPELVLQLGPRTRRDGKGSAAIRRLCVFRYRSVASRRQRLAVARRLALNDGHSAHTAHFGHHFLVLLFLFPLFFLFVHSVHALLNWRPRTAHCIPCQLADGQNFTKIA
ncbi:unnamed protein product [Protopolystoma xenopodis]|uniref:Uncharacterized protein n=1 Tax=Protopolystoma xenopodis TaxID=117903 RepID=A0A3S5AAC6_9PLAT|nr:unnamed protein product [Protopolystoma xenopodis]